MKEVKIVSDGHGRRIFVDGQELPNNKPDYIKQQIDKEGEDSRILTAKVNKKMGITD